MGALSNTSVSTHCSNCGFTNALPSSTESLRCLSCGRFVSWNPDVCCAKHELRESPYPSGECPMCEQERQIQAERQHMMTRDPTLEPY